MLGVMNRRDCKYLTAKRMLKRDLMLGWIPFCLWLCPGNSYITSNLLKISEHPIQSLWLHLSKLFFLNSPIHSPPLLINVVQKSRTLIIFFYDNFCLQAKVLSIFNFFFFFVMKSLISLRIFHHNWSAKRNRHNI